MNLDLSGFINIFKGKIQRSKYWVEPSYLIGFILINVGWYIDSHDWAEPSSREIQTWYVQESEQSKQNWDFNESPCKLVATSEIKLLFLHNHIKHKDATSKLRNSGMWTIVIKSKYLMILHVNFVTNSVNQLLFLRIHTTLQRCYLEVETFLRIKTRVNWNSLATVSSLIGLSEKWNISIT